MTKTNIYGKSLSSMNVREAVAWADVVVALDLVVVVVAVDIVVAVNFVVAIVAVDLVVNLLVVALVVVLTTDLVHAVKVSPAVVILAIIPLQEGSIQLSSKKSLPRRLRQMKNDFVHKLVNHKEHDKYSLFQNSFRVTLISWNYLCLKIRELNSYKYGS